ncbi:DUF934 domain-containing protein [Agrobacterium sp. T29]|uniref:DUF934 domain-containing protein n=1 Tax=Agrobacterium sp. T29 TaxID=2580515 RepID=UPI001FEE0557|nr:DUF934 domain-containing protein [Agrobacterium sp. T29]
MVLIDSQANVVPDKWMYPDAEKNVSVGPYCILPLGALASLDSDSSGARPLGVYAAAGTTSDQLAPYFDQLDLIAVEFPRFRDGRGFTLARTLREKYGFKGDIRAIGHILPDQFAALLRCGITSIRLPPDHPAREWYNTLPGVACSTAGGPLLQRLLAGRAKTGGKT